MYHWEKILLTFLVLCFHVPGLPIDFSTLSSRSCSKWTVNGSLHSVQRYILINKSHLELHSYHRLKPLIGISPEDNKINILYGIWNISLVKSCFISTSCFLFVQHIYQRTQVLRIAWDLRPKLLLYLLKFFLCHFHCHFHYHPPPFHHRHHHFLHLLNFLFYNHRQFSQFVLHCRHQNHHPYHYHDALPHHHDHHYRHFCHYHQL